MRSLASRLRFLFLMGSVVALGSVGLAADDWPEWRGAAVSASGTRPASSPPSRKRAAGQLADAHPSPDTQDRPSPAAACSSPTHSASRPTTRSSASSRSTRRPAASSGRRNGAPNYSGLFLVYAIGPRATPTVDGDRVYVLGAMGNLLALDVSTGRILWQKDYVKDFNVSVPTWGMSGAPLVDGDRLICLVGGEPDGKIIALDKLTGEEIWRSLSSDSEPGYNQPIIIEAGGARQLIIFHADGFASLDPKTGKVYWEIEHRVQMGIVVSTPVHSGPYLFFTSQWGGARMLRLDDARPAATLLWSGPGEQDPGMTRETPNTLNSVISTPVIDGEYLYGIDNDGQLRCLEAATGKLVWKTTALLKERAMYGTAFFVRHGDRYFINNDRGELVIARLSPTGFEEISRATLIEPTHPVRAPPPDAERPVVARGLREPPHRHPQRQRDRAVLARERTVSPLYDP